ncbi:hypothetical protein Tco_0070635 [Tanacetum coccineum]
MLSRLWMSWCRNGDDDAVDSAEGWCVVAVVKMAVEARGIVDRLDPVKRSIFEVVGLDAAVLTYLAVLFDTATLGKLCLAVLTGTYLDFVKTTVGTKFFLGYG